MRFKLPKLSVPVSSVIVHYVAVFVVAFGGYLSGNAMGITSVSALTSVLASAAIAGGVAVFNVILGLIPVADQSSVWRNAISLKVKSAADQLAVSAAVMFVGTLGAQLATGALHATSIPDVAAVVIAAVSAAVFAVVSYVAGLLPTPKH